MELSGTSRRAFLRSVGLAGLGLSLGVNRSLAHGPVPWPVIQARLSAARGWCPQLLVGVELGSAKVCVAVGEQTKDGLMKILGVGESPSVGIRWSEVVDADAASRSVRAALMAAEENSDVVIRSVHLATLGGSSEFGSGRRAKNSIACLEGLGLEVCDVALPPVPCEWALLDVEEKQHGVLMIDLGAGKTGHVLYQRGETIDYGTHRAGSAHVTNDLSIGLRMPWERAEMLKIEKGCAITGSSLVDADDPGAYARAGGRYSDMEVMQVHIYLRWREILEKIKARLVEKGARFDQIGAGVQLTGGGSLQLGIVELASEVFGLPAFRARAKGFVGTESLVENPQYSCALGLLKLGEWRDGGSPSLQLRRRYFGLVPEGYSEADRSRS